jgi:hypothetical protein
MSDTVNLFHIALVNPGIMVSGRMVCCTQLIRRVIIGAFVVMQDELRGIQLCG